MRNKLFKWALITSFCMLNWSCSILHPESLAKDEEGYLTKHYNSCGPSALSKAFNEFARKNGILAKKSWTRKELSREIQDSGNIIRLMASLIHHETVMMTLPSELKNIIKNHGFKIIKVKNLEDLNKVDVAIVLVSGDYLKGDLHWLCFPVDNRITDYFGKNTKIEKIFLLKKVD